LTDDSSVCFGWLAANVIVSNVDGALPANAPAKLRRRVEEWALQKAWRLLPATRNTLGGKAAVSFSRMLGGNLPEPGLGKPCHDWGI